MAAIETIEHCWIPMPDGVRLSARIWLPEMARSDPAPAILEYIPYRKRDMVRARDERNHPFFARNGYAAIRVDMRGSGDSEGVMRDMYEDTELDDAVTVINWIARQPWCDGSVGMMGTSWGGTASLQAACRRPAPLKAIICVCTTNNRFDDDIHHMGGCLLTDTVEWGATLPVILASPPDPETVGGDWRRIWHERLEALSFPLEDWVRHETRNAYWRHAAVNETPDAFGCPALFIGGWADRYSNTVMNLLAESHDTCWGIVGPWGHHFPDAALPGPGIRFQVEALRWWNRWLKDERNGIDDEAKLRVWMQTYDTPADCIETRSGRWISFRAWPSHHVSDRQFWLCNDKILSQAPEALVEHEIPWSLAVGTAAGDTGYFGREGGLPLDQTEDDAGSLVFESEPLTEPVEIIGAARLHLEVTIDQPVATLVARLVDVSADGTAARFGVTIRNLALDADGQPNDRQDRKIVMTFANTAYRFEQGHRMRVALSSSYWPVIWPSPQPAKIIAHGAAKLVLPLLQSEDGDGVIAFEPPNPDDIEQNFETISAPSIERSVSIDEVTGERLTTWHQPYRALHLTEIGLDFGYETRAVHRIKTDNPNSASSRFEHRMGFERDDLSICVTGTAELTSTPSSYNLNGEVSVSENGKTIFTRRWSPVVRRKHS